MIYNYCPICGGKLISKYSYDEGGVPYCEKDDMMFFNTPKPCIVVAVIKEDEVLLLKQSYIYENSKVLISGYVCINETLEETVYRETLEETGIKVDNIKYLGSDFVKDKDLLMITFMANYKEGILLKSDEVEGLGWVKISEALDQMEEDFIGIRAMKKAINLLRER